MAAVTSVTATVANALAGTLTTVGESSMGRVVAGVDAAAHNLINSAMVPMTSKLAKNRGYKFRNNGARGPPPELTPQQLKITETSMDKRNMKMQEDAVNLLTRAAQTSEAINREHPDFEKLGAVHVTLTFAVPVNATIQGYDSCPPSTAAGDEDPKTKSALFKDVGYGPSYMAPSNPSSDELSDSEADLFAKKARRRLRKTRASGPMKTSRMNMGETPVMYSGQAKTSKMNMIRREAEIAQEREEQADAFDAIARALGRTKTVDPNRTLPPAPPVLKRLISRVVQSKKPSKAPEGGLGFSKNDIDGAGDLAEESDADSVPGLGGDNTDSSDSEVSVYGPGGNPFRMQPMVDSSSGNDCGPNDQDDDSSSDESEEGDDEQDDDGLWSNLLSDPEPSLKTLGEALKAKAASNPRDEGYECTPGCPSWCNLGAAKEVMKGFLRAANVSGMRDLYVLNVIIPTEVLTVCFEVADSLMGEGKLSKNLHVQKVIRKLKRIISDRIDHSVYNYVETITILVIMGLLLDLGETTKNHCNITKYSGTQPTFQDFFANHNLEEAIDDLAAAKKEAGHPVEGIVFAVPAETIVSGTLNETMVVYETEKLTEYELTEKKPIVGAVVVGVDLMGKPSPNDHKNPINYAGGMYRHFGDSETKVVEGTPHEYVVSIDRSEKSTISANHQRVWEDLTDDHCEDFKELLTNKDQRFDFDFLEDGKPGSYSAESYMKWLEEQIQDESFFCNDTALNDLLRASKYTRDFMKKHKQKNAQQVKASGNLKKGEDSKRSRLVVAPGMAGSEGLHQARVSPIVKAIEILHAILYNHTNLKGLSEETKRIRFAEFLRAIAKGGICFGTDKSKNDSCFREAVWRMCVKYLARLNDIFIEKTETRAYVFSPNEATADSAFPTGTLDLTHFIMRITPMLAILLSGIGPTSLFNRLESTVENGVTVLDVHGEEAYLKWRKAERHAPVSTHPAWALHEQPHVADFAYWEPLAPHMVTDTSIKCDSLEDAQIETFHMGINEGDDQTHVIIPPNYGDWKLLSPHEVAQKYTAQMSRSTGFIFEAALPVDDMDLVGRNSTFEMLSAWVGLPAGNASAYEVAVIVPKPLKALRKIAHSTISSQHTLVPDEHDVPVSVERNALFSALALTKFYALVIINQESLGIRGLMLGHGDFWYRELEGLIGKDGAYFCATAYGDRDPENRKIEEAKSTTFDYCGALRDSAHEAISKVKVARVTRTCCTAWRTELALSHVKKEDVIAALLAFDNITLTLEITHDHITDAMLLWQELEIGCLLKPLVMQATSNHCKVAALFRGRALQADSEETVQLARMYAGTKPNDVAAKDSKSVKADPSTEKGKGKGKGKPSEVKRREYSQSEKLKGKGKYKGTVGKGGKGIDSKGKTAGKASDKGKSKGKPDGKGEAKGSQAVAHNTNAEPKPKAEGFLNAAASSVRGLTLDWSRGSFKQPVASWTQNWSPDPAVQDEWSAPGLKNGFGDAAASTSNW